jgi:hypothetical protein
VKEAPEQRGSGAFSSLDVRGGAKDKVKAERHLKLFWLETCPFETWKALLTATYPRDEFVAEYLTLTDVRSRRPL